MKKLLCALLMLTVLISTSLFAFADEIPEKVEISFKVGDSILFINDVEVEVETPYVAGEGTTLVPLRVITEAFGAVVDWEDATETITLEYPDVNITLQIGNIIAKVNDHSETLLEAPVLSDNGFTMVPLRFISETFGAIVSYDEATEAILVTKETLNGGEIIQAATDKDFIGDSYYGWKMNTPKNMTMAERSFDGSNTIYVADNNDAIIVSISRTSGNDMSFDEYYTKIKDLYSSYTLSRSEKLTDAAGNKYMVLEGKTKTDYLLFYSFETDDYFYDIAAVCSASNTDFAESKKAVAEIVDSFKITSSIGDDVYDLSNVANGYRKFTDDTYKVSLNLPAELYQAKSADNVFRFTNNDYTNTVSLGIYSISNDTNAESLANKDHAIKVLKYNPKLTTISDITSGDGGYQYTLTTKGSVSNDLFAIDKFIELGDYVYNITVTVPLSKGESFANSIINSLEMKELDKSVIGNVLRVDDDQTAKISVPVGNYTFYVPETWKTFESDSNSAYVMDTLSNAAIAFSYENNINLGSTTVAEVAESFVKSQLDKYTKEKSVSTVTLNNINFATFTLKDKKTGICTTSYLGVKNKTMLSFMLLESDIFYGGNNQEILVDAIESLVTK